MDARNADFLVGLILGGIIFCLIGLKGILLLSSATRNLAKERFSHIYNYFGLFTGLAITLWVVFLLFVLVYLWTK